MPWVNLLVKHDRVAGLVGFFTPEKLGEDESVLTNSFQRGLDEENGGRGFEDSGEILPSNQKKNEDFIYCS